MSDQLKPLIAAALTGPLTRDQAEAAFGILFDGDATPAQMAAFLVTLGCAARRSRRSPPPRA